jgi:hypothetical protein
VRIQLWDNWTRAKTDALAWLVTHVESDQNSFEGTGAGRKQALLELVCLQILPHVGELDLIATLLITHHADDALMEKVRSSQRYELRYFEWLFIGFKNRSKVYSSIAECDIFTKRSHLFY